jgi:hypothetical protein
MRSSTMDVESFKSGMPQDNGAKTSDAPFESLLNSEEAPYAKPCGRPRAGYEQHFRCGNP